MEGTQVHVQSYLHTIILRLFFKDSQFKLLVQPKCCVDIIDNLEDAPIFVLDDNGRESKNSLKMHWEIYLVVSAFWKMPA